MDSASLINGSTIAFKVGFNIFSSINAGMPDIASGNSDFSTFVILDSAIKL